MIPLSQQFPNGSIIQLENDDESYASDVLSDMIEKARDDRRKRLRQFICSFWDNESWESIIEKAETEGSVWYVWWMDGVRELMKNFENIPC